MTDAPNEPQQPPPAAAAAASDDKTMPIVVYALYLASFVAGVTVIIGVVLAYLNKDAAPDWIKSHYQFQIRTFWISLIAGVIALPLCMIGIGFVLMAAICVWFAVRSIVGLVKLNNGEAYPNPQTWMI